MFSNLSNDANFKRLKELLREMFQLNRGDLDFGLYRVMNMKSEEVSKFLDEELLPQVEKALGLAQQAAVQQVEEKLAKAEAKASYLGLPEPEQAPLVMEVKEELSEARRKNAQPTDIYNHLYQFFNRYYYGGDFMSLRRYKAYGKEAYLIPYNGEEVKLHWANADQYYIKTTANYQSYVFTLGSGGAQKRVRFQIAAADNEKDNIKEADDKQRRFVLAKDAVRMDDEALTVSFERRQLTAAEKTTYGSQGRTQQQKLNAEAEGKILRAAKKIDATWQTLLAAPPRLMPMLNAPCWPSIWEPMSPKTSLTISSIKTSAVF